MQRVAAGVLLLLLLAATDVFAGPPEDEKDTKDTSYSYYLISCGTYIHHHESGTPSDIHNTADTFYVAGWISAYNRLENGSAIPEDTTLDDVMLWLEEYCTDHPLSNLEAGLYALSEEVKPRSAAPPARPQPAAPAQPPRQPAEPPPFHAPVRGLTPLPY